MKRLTVLLCGVVLVFGVVGIVDADLITIGTATYLGSNYNLIYEDDSIDGGLVWLDYTKHTNNWQNQKDWASGLGDSLTVNLAPDYITNIDWSTGWRLPLAQDQTDGFNQTGSEMGHLYYESLGKPAYGPLGDASPFNNLQPFYYWSGTAYILDPDGASSFHFDYGNQYYHYTWDAWVWAMAVHPGQVSPIPEPSTILLLGSGLISLLGFRRKFRK